MAEGEEELKSFLMKVKEQEGKSWLKIQHLKNKDHGIQSHHFVANRWGNSGNSDRLFFWLQNQISYILCFNEKVVLIFLLEILIPACASSSLAFCMMYSAYKLNKQDDNI